MSIDKKLTKIKEVIIDEAKRNEQLLDMNIKQYMSKIDTNNQFLASLNTVKGDFKNSRVHNSTVLALKSFLKAGELINSYRGLDLSERLQQDSEQNLFENE